MHSRKLVGLYEEDRCMGTPERSLVIFIKNVNCLREFNLIEQCQNSLILHNFNIRPCAKYGLSTST